MAFLPCDYGPHRNLKRNIYYYLGFAGSDGIVRRKGRLCERHWGEVESHLAQYEVVDDASGWNLAFDTFLCATCGQPIDERGLQVFVTAYPTHNDRKDYWFGVHAECHAPDWLTYNGVLLGTLG